ncbi:hypothetical protein [Paracoccus ravus]|uniref:hypothetical protein n=1 Tax=Paracoccus ravus TaxID=2447760 RepID=UPI003144F7E5
MTSEAANRARDAHRQDPSVAASGDPTELGVVDLVRAIRSKEYSCREVIQACLARIEAKNPTYNAIVSLQDPEKLLTAAEKADRA